MAENVTGSGWAAHDPRLQRAFSIDTVGVLFFSLRGHLIDTNAAFARMSGYSREALLQLEHWEALTAPEFMPVTLRAAGELIETGETRPYEKQMIRRDGSRWWGLFAPRRIAGSGRDGECVEFIIDITERKRSEAELQRTAAALYELDERRRMALDAAQLGTWTLDVAAGHLELDARAQAHYGLETSRPTTAQMKALIHPDDVDDLERAMFASLDPLTRGPVGGEFRVVPPEGHVRWIAVSGLVRFATVDGVEAPTFAIGTTRDITEQKQAERALHEADQRKDEFLAILAHELRNPLAPIRTAAGLLHRRDLPEPLVARARDTIERQVAHMARLVDDLLDVSRLSRGTIALQRTRVPLHDVLDLAIETARPLIEERQQDLRITRPPTHLAVQADPARLSQVFANLLNNAAKYTPPGGRIEVDVLAEASDLLVRVRDTGQGIAPEHLERVFDMFAQGSGAPSVGGGGLGIGLALARRLVELHGGTLIAESAGRGQGATFTVRIPASQSAGDPPAAAASSGEPRASNPGMRVLIVDDNVDAADMLAMLLESSGCDVRTAYNGQQALREATTFAPELVLLDLGMPGLDGIETCRRLRALPNGSAMRIVAVTGWGQDESRRQTELAGFDAHLVKPVEPDALLRFIGETGARRPS